MTGHLTDQEISNWMLGSPDAHALAHLQICSECSAELQQLKGALGTYGDAMRSATARDEIACARERAVIIDRLRRPAPFRFGQLGLVAAMMLLALAVALMIRAPRPVQRTTNTPAKVVQQQQDADDALLVEIQQDLQSNVPEALAPGLVLSAERNRLIAVNGSNTR